MVTIILAQSQDGVIGTSGGILPWGKNMRSDLQRFKEMTTGHPVIMGRKTWDSLGRPLPKRRNIVISRNLDFRPEGCEVARSWYEATRLAEGEDAFVIGGAEIYRLALASADRIESTIILGTFRGDVLSPLPQLKDQPEWNLTGQELHEADARNDWPYMFETWSRVAAATDTQQRQSFVVLEHARSEQQSRVMEGIQDRGECPFCMENLAKTHTNPILAEGAHWLVTRNRWPYEHTREHILIISRRHASRLGDLRGNGVGDELILLMQNLEAELGIESGAAFLRFGKPAYNGGSVDHLHFHVIVPDMDGDWEKIKVKMGVNPKKITPTPA